MRRNSRFSGIVVCAAIFVWMQLSELRNNSADLESSIEDIEYATSELQSDLSNLKQDVGSEETQFESYGSSQSERIEEAERRARNAEITAADAYDKIRQVEREMEILRLGGY